ncbi:MAG: DUF2271 domain-containing protein [Planctomycetes bacterium]|nr:DUF2271 domain-containing protein [Planctomycetota bacterium]
MSHCFQLLRVALATACPLSLPAAFAQGEPRTLRFDHENILGTSMHLELRAEEHIAKRAKVELLDEIERLRKVLSTYDAKSELRKLPKPCPPTPASADLRAVMHACDTWRAASSGAFHPGVEVLTKLWGEAQKRGSVPSESELAAARAQLTVELWTIDDAAGTVRIASDTPLSFDALAKGFIIDRAVAAAQAAGAHDVLLEIGGDLRVTGSSRSRVSVADPRQPADNAEKLCQLDLQGVAVATSGGYARGFDIGGKHYSHILDPRTGMPVERVLQATVIAPDAVTADALATILNVLSPEDGLALVAKTPGAASMVVDAAGAQHASPAWSKYVRASANAASKGPSVLPGEGQIVLAFEIQQPPPESERGGERGGERGRERGGERGGDRRGGGYRRPYVAVWIENQAGQSVRTLCLWIEKPRWIDDLRRWSKLYAQHEDDVEAVTRATRAPGKYELTWDGRDDLGQPVPAGPYSMYLEVVREHGTYQLLSQKFAIDGIEFSKAMTGDGIEVKSATLAFRLPAPKK